MKTILGELERNDIFYFRGSKTKTQYRVTLITGEPNNPKMIHYNSLKDNKPYKKDLTKQHDYNGSFCTAYNRSIIIIIDSKS